MDDELVFDAVRYAVAHGFTEFRVRTFMRGSRRMRRAGPEGALQALKAMEGYGWVRKEAHRSDSARYVITDNMPKEGDAYFQKNLMGRAINRKGRLLLYPFQAMKVGDVVSYPMRHHTMIEHKEYQVAKNVGRRHGIKFKGVMNPDRESFTITRVE